MANKDKSMEDVLEIIHTARKRVGLYPININHIKQYIDTVEDSDEVIYKDEKFDMVRCEAAN